MFDKLYSAFVRILNSLEFILSSFCLLILIVAMSSDAISRYLFSGSQTWAVPLSSLVLVWFSYLSSSMAFREDSHQAFSFLHDKFPKWLKEALVLLQNFLVIIAFVLVIRAGMKLQLIQKLQVLPGLGLSRKWLTYGTMVGSGLMIFTAFLKTLKLLVDGVRSISGRKRI